MQKSEVQNKVDETILRFRTFAFCILTSPPHLLFVCSRNRWRSPTAEKLCAGRQDCVARSAGTEPSARVRINADHLRWADLVLCMERKHVRRLREMFPDSLQGKRVVCLDIPDDFGFMDPELVELLAAALAEHLPTPTIMPDDIERNLGAQPLARLLAEHALKANDLVAHSTEQLTHKMVARACKGRRLTPNVQAKVLRALNAASGRQYRMAELFTY